MNCHPALSFCLSMISAQTLRVCREGKPVPTFPDHAPVPGITNRYCSPSFETATEPVIGRAFARPVGGLLRMRSNLLKHNNLMLRSERRERLEAWAASNSPISHSRCQCMIRKKPAPHLMRGGHRFSLGTSAKRLPGDHAQIK